MTVNERIKILIEKLEEENQRKFALKIGVSTTGLNSMLPGNRESKPSFEVLNKILSTYPQVSATWLLTGEGEMFKAGTDVATPPAAGHHYVGSSKNKINVGNVPTTADHSDIEYYRQRIRELEQTNTELLNKIMQLLTKKE